MIAVSRCLIGENCTYAGKNNLCKEIKELYDQGLVLPLCPEVLGGLPIPRTPCEVIGEKVIDQKGIDRTKEYTQGAKIALDKCLEKNIKIAVLKAKSPSCGKNHIYDGTFSHQLVEGDGIFVQMLKEKGIAVYSENEVTLNLSSDTEYGENLFSRKDVSNFVSENDITVEEVSTIAVNLMTKLMNFRFFGLIYGMNELNDEVIDNSFYDSKVGM